MHRTSRSFFSIAALAVCALGAAAYATLAVPAQAIVRHVIRAATIVRDWALDGFKLAAQDEGSGFARPAVLIVQARAFVMRLAKRERPVHTASWRMCPST